MIAGIIVIAMYAVCMGFFMWLGALIVDIVRQEVAQTRWGKLRAAHRQLFGELRVRILKKMFELEDLRVKIGDPEGKLYKALEKCQENLEKLDLAIVRIHESVVGGVASAVGEVDQQCREVNRTLAECSSDPIESSDVPLAAEPQCQSVSRIMAIQ